MATKPANSVLTHSAIKFWMSIVAALVALGMTWGAVTTRLTAIEATVTVNEAKIEAIYESYTTIEVRLAEIELHLVYIREKIGAK